MYEDLDQIASLKFNKEMQAVSKHTREKLQESKNWFAAQSAGGRSGQQEALLGRIQIEGAEQMGRFLYQTWVDLIKKRNGFISRRDVAFITSKIDDFAKTQKGHLHQAFAAQLMGTVVNLLAQEADIRMSALISNAHTDLEIMVRESEAFPGQATVNEEHHVLSSEESKIRMTRHSAIVLNVLIASPSDVNEEREVVTKAINEWNAAHFSGTGIMLNPVKWESHSYPASGNRPQAIINKQLVESGDILIGIFGYKLGTPTGVAQSGTIEEIEEFRKAGKYIALYFSTADVPRHADRNQLEALEAFKNERRNDTLYFDFQDSQALHDHLTGHLPKIVQDVLAQLQLSVPSQASNPNPSTQRDSPNKAAAHTSNASSTLLADIISELEDNLDCASRPQTGDTYRRPSNRAWLENRNKIALPPEILLEVKNVYNRIGSWADIVSSGLSPNYGSMELNMIASDLRSSLPFLIDRLKKLNSAS